MPASEIQQENDESFSSKDSIKNIISGVLEGGGHD